MVSAGGIHLRTQYHSELGFAVAGASPKKVFTCQLCGKVLCSKASLKRHIADKHAERQEEYRCVICERVYCSRNSLMTHIYTYHKSRPGDIDIKFFQPEHHLPEPSASTMQFPTGTTTTTFPLLAALCCVVSNCAALSCPRHQPSACPSSSLLMSPPPPSTPPGIAGGPMRMPPPTSGGINEPQECPYCRRTFSCYYSLKRHFQDKHEQSDTLYVCEFCHRRYRTKNSLTTHKSLQHRGSSGMLKRLLKTTAIKSVLGATCSSTSPPQQQQLPPHLQ